jgi:hypothetical protein
MARFTCICWSITSETRMLQGSRVRRHGRSRPFSSYQEIRALRTASTLLSSGSKPIEWMGFALTSRWYGRRPNQTSKTFPELTKAPYLERVAGG